jgi:hypothetical protein
MAEGALQHVHRHTEYPVGGIVDLSAAGQFACDKAHNGHIL